jgi:succinate dehydrogenase / fumarate reductase flavoprotein subunit
MEDVIIIGSGGAGLSAALSAKEITDKVLVISKTYPTHSQTVQAQGGINCVMDYENDSIINHINDTYKSSKHLAIINNIRKMCEDAKDTIIWLDKIGVPFSRDTNGKIEQRYFGGTKAKRTCYSSDYTGLKIIHTLYDTCIKNNIDFLNEHILIDIIIKDGDYKGVKILDLICGEVKNIYSKTLIIASGGYSNIYSSHTTNSTSTTGDGLAIAFKNGIKLSNLEFVQFHPTSLKSSNILISETARAEGAYLVDEQGKRFTDELSTRDEVARAIKTIMNNNGNVYLDMRHINIKTIKEKMPQELKLINDILNLDVQKDLIPIEPAAHYTMGGILTNVSCETSVKNIYACGEVAQSNVHGANRLGGNSLLEIITFGKIAGENAAKISEKTYREDFEANNIDNNYTNKLLEKKLGKSIYTIKSELSEYMFENAGLFRTEESLKNLLNKITELEIYYNTTGIIDKSKNYNKNMLDYIELGNLILIAKLTCICALERKESRGSHYRKDYTEEDKEYQKISTIQIINNNIKYKVEEI